MTGHASIWFDRVCYTFGFVVAFLLMYRPLAVFRFLGDEKNDEVTPGQIRVMQVLAIVVAAGTASHVILTFF